MFFENTLERLSVMNPVRCLAFGYSVNDKSALSWAAKAAGEMGEILQSIAYSEDGKEGYTNEHLEKEIADVIIYLDLLCSKKGIDICSAVRKKFNQVSDKVGSNIKFDSAMPW